MSKTSKKKNILYFLKYFLVFRRRSTKLYTLARFKSKLHKKRFYIKKKKITKLSNYFFKNYKYLSFEKKQTMVLNNLNVFFKQSTKFDKAPKLYDINRKYMNYLRENRLIYKLFGFRVKNNFKFIKRHVRSISSLDIKSRIHMHEYSLKNILIKLKYAFTFRNSKNLIKSGFIFLNGSQTINYNNYLFKGDYIELLYCKFILKLKNKIKKKLLISMRKYKRYNWRMLKNKVEFSERKLRIFRFAEKIFHFKNKITNSIQFDYRTLSFIIIKDLSVKKDISYLTKKLLPTYLIKLFNWKVIS